MSITDDFHQIVDRLRGWGFQVTEWSGCYGRQTGSWPSGRPEGHINHHFVCSLNPDQGYINGLVGNLASNKTVQWFADVHGVAYLIGTGQMSHAGTGNSYVRDRTRNDQAPSSNPAGNSGDISGNPYYSGTECQHPGDSTPSPGPMLDVMVAINAAEFLQWGYTANRAINHSEWSNRKIDMSAGGGINSGGWSAAELRRRVAARMSGTSPTEPEIDMASTATVLVDGQPNVFAVAKDGKIYQQWPDPGKEGGWSGWSAGVPGEWAGGLSAVANPLPQIWGVGPDGGFYTVWSSGDRWNGPVPWVGIESI